MKERLFPVLLCLLPLFAGAVWPGTGKIETSTLFRERRHPAEAPTAAGDYRLTAASPCIDSAARSGAPAEKEPALLPHGDSRDERRPVP